MWALQATWVVYFYKKTITVCSLGAWRIILHTGYLLFLKSQQMNDFSFSYSQYLLTEIENPHRCLRSKTTVVEVLVAFLPKLSLDRLLEIKMISAEHSNNNGKNEVTKKPHGMVLFWIQLRRTYRDLSSQADSARENWTWSYPYFT